MNKPPNNMNNVNNNGGGMPTSTPPQQAMSLLPELPNHLSILFDDSTVIVLPNNPIKYILLIFHYRKHLVQVGKILLKLLTTH
jgi:hypothetical protein